MRILNYIVNAVPYMALSLPIVLVWRILRNRHLKQQGIISSIPRETVLVIFALFYVGVASQTLIPKLEMNMDGSFNIMQQYGRSINIIPFHQVPILIEEVLQKQNYSYFLVNILGNICFFMPLGFSLPLLWRCTRKRMLLIVLTSAVSIELLQLIVMTGRATDIDDVIIYMAGAYIGYSLYSLFNKLFPKYLVKFKVIRQHY